MPKKGGPGQVTVGEFNTCRGGGGGKGGGGGGCSAKVKIRVKKSDVVTWGASVGV